VKVVLGVDQSRNESCLGASEAAGVLGLDKYNPPIKIWRRHRGLPLPPDGNNEAALWGSLIEPVVRGHYALETNAYVYVPTESMTMDGWLRCTPDGLVWELRGPEVVADLDGHAAKLANMAGVPDGILQVKTCSAWLEDDWEAGPPAKYEVQARVEMAVVGRPWNDVPCLCGGQRYLGPFRIERDLAIEDRILTSLAEFWKMVVDGTEPSVDHTEAWRMHVSEKMERTRPTVITATGDMLLEVERWRRLRAAVNRAERDLETTKNRVLLYLGASGGTRIDAGKLGRATAYRTPKGTWALKSPTAWRDDE
jgi:predicted phage-related endonuclease